MQNSTGLEHWIERATRCLAADSALQVRKEIQEHYESARQEWIGGGASALEAERSALAALGDAGVANRQYRRVLLTVDEAKLLRRTQWESRALCRWLRWLFLLPVAGLSAGSLVLANGDSWLGWTLMLGSAGFGLLVASPFLPIYTRERSRVFRTFRWAWMAAVLLLAFWPDPVKQSWLLVACAWPMFVTERTLVSVRRKLPVGQWPRQLFL
jgi:hypothetical protein